jgi:cell division protein FtsB
LTAECAALRDQLATTQAELETTRTRAQEAADELAKLKTGKRFVFSEFFVHLSN